MTPRQVEELYRAMGKTFGALEPWQIYVLTSAESFERLYGRRADKVRKLYNGMIPCYLYQFFKTEATLSVKKMENAKKQFQRPYKKREYVNKN